MMVKAEWVRRFKRDAENHLTEIRRGMQALPPELGRATTQDEIEAEQFALRELFRHAHTIKGSALMVGLEEIGEAGLKLEEMLGKAYLEPAQFNQASRTEVEQQVAAIEALLKDKN